MGKILERIGDSATNVKAGVGESIFIGKKVAQIEREFYQGVLILADGDLTQYEQLKKLTVSEYLIKLEDFVARIEHKR